MKAWCVGLVLALAGVGVGAQESNWRLYVGLGAASGGERITSGIITTDGTHQQTPFQIAPGTGPQFRLGADYRLGGRFTLQGSLGYSSSDPMGYNGSYDFTVVPVEFLGFAEVMAGLRIGLGLRQSTAKLSGTGLAADSPYNGTFSGHNGSVLELQYLFSSTPAKSGNPGAQFGLSLRRVSEKFSHPLGELNGDHSEIGLAVYY